MKLLSIGNSFSVDAQRYLHEIAVYDGFELDTGNLYKGGCSLEQHCGFMQTGEKGYEFFLNNESKGGFTLLEGLEYDDWDIITVQQASHFSGISETYYPYLTELVAYVRKLKPKAEIVMHETWAYEFNSTHHAFPNYKSDRRLMHTKLKAAYTEAAAEIGARILPVGDAVCLARENPVFDPEKGGTALTRDGFHLSLTLGRYLAAAVWYECLTGRDIRNIGFRPEGEETDEMYEILKDVCHKVTQ